MSKTVSYSINKYTVFTSSDFCRRSFDCCRNVCACCISFSSKLISSGLTGQPCFSKSAMIEALLLRNEGTLSSGYLVYKERRGKRSLVTKITMNLLHRMSTDVQGFPDGLLVTIYTANDTRRYREKL